MTDLMQAIRDRRERAIGVRAAYTFEQVTPTTWLVQHPAEDDRQYLVDTAKQACECPDFQCRKDEMGGWCKHLWAVDALQREQRGEQPAPFTLNGRPTTDSGSYVVAQVDADGADPFKTL